MSNAYRFSNFDRVPVQPPTGWQITLLEKAFGDDPLTREEKDQIANILYGTFGSQSSDYKLSGWCWPMSRARQMRRILVSFRYERGTFRTYYAPDKTSLRAVLSDVAEMVYAPRRRKKQTA